jgi:hypothetical protein
MAISYPHGMEHKMSLIFGSDINAFSKPGKLPTVKFRKQLSPHLMKFA